MVVPVCAYDNTQFIITMNLNYETFLLHVCFINVCTVFHV